MAKNRAEWASGHRQLTRIGLSDGCGGELIPVAVQSGYHRNKFEGHLGNVGWIYWSSYHEAELLLERPLVESDKFAEYFEQRNGDVALERCRVKLKILIPRRYER